MCSWWPFRRHTWTAWKDIETGELAVNGRNVGTFIIQQRECTACKQKQLHTATARLPKF